MEEDKKKRKGKKKKNKQSKTVGDGLTAVGETTSGDQNLVNHGKGDEHSQLLETADVQSRNVVDSNGHGPNGKECAIPEEIIQNLRNENYMHVKKEVISEQRIKKLKEENDMHVKKEAILEETIRKLKEENDMHIQKEAISEEMLRKVKEENDMHIQREAMSEETIRQLREQTEMCIQKEDILEKTRKTLNKKNDMPIKKEALSNQTINKLKEENNMHIQKEVNFEETINQLRNENELQTQKQDCMEMRIAQLQSEKDSLIQKEAGLEEKVNQLLNEKSNLSQQGESLEERIKFLEGDLSSSIEENSAKETYLSLNGDISRLQVQLAELEESRNSLLLENQRLMENVPGLQLAIQNLGKSSSASSRSVDASAKDNVSEHEDLKNQIEAARMLVGKLVEENAGLVEKVNELYVELDQRSATAELSGATVPDGMTEYAEPAGVAIPIPESEEITSVSAQELDSLEDVPVQHKNDTIDAKNVAGVVSDSLMSDGSGEIVQIPLDDNEVRDQKELEDAKNVEKDVVPITDAPLIGAPFRLISFVAKYVSGADLVNKSSSDASH